MLQCRKEHSEESRKQVRSNGSEQWGKASQIQHLRWGLTKGCAAKTVGGGKTTGEAGEAGWGQLHKGPA